MLSAIAAAQTNLSLYERLDALGYSASDLRYVRDCYEFATCLVAGRFRASGKTFISHLIGTASILAEIAAPVPVVAAGLVHGVYRHGDFGLATWKRKRARVSAAVGSDVEQLVWDYTWLPWDDPSIHEWLSRDPPEEPERTLIVMRLANDLEEFLDHAAFLGDTPPTAPSCRNLISLAEHLQQPRLAAGFIERDKQGTGPAWTQLLHTQRADCYWLALPSSRIAIGPARRLRNLWRRTKRPLRARG